jgi:hypothetical protein
MSIPIQTEMTLQEQHTITDKQAIRKAICAPAVMPDSFLDRKLIPIGMSKFKGDKMPPNWSCNDKFEVGKEYPIYESDGNIFPIGNDGIGKKIVPTAWTKIKYF